MYPGGSIPILYYPMGAIASGGVIPPPPSGNFLLLDGTDFLLLDGTNLLLLGT